MDRLVITTAVARESSVRTGSIRVLTCHIGSDSDNDGYRRLRGLNFLQIVVLTWYYPRASNIKWRDQWQTKGYLWSDPITSIPMPFKVETNAPVLDCP